MLLKYGNYIAYKISLVVRDFANNQRAPLVLSEMLNRCDDSVMYEQVRFIVMELIVVLDRNDQVRKNVFFCLQSTLDITSPNVHSPYTKPSWATGNYPIKPSCCAKTITEGVQEELAMNWGSSYQPLH
jgi:hypothetical protein